MNIMRIVLYDTYNSTSCLSICLYLYIYLIFWSIFEMKWGLKYDDFKFKSVYLCHNLVVLFFVDASYMIFFVHTKNIPTMWRPNVGVQTCGRFDFIAWTLCMYECVEKNNRQEDDDDNNKEALHANPNMCSIGVGGNGR